MTPNWLHPWLLPYDPYLVGASGIPRALFALPPVRCTDDRCMACQLREPVIAGGMLDSWHASSTQIPDIITGPASWVVEAMVRNANRTGASITAGISGVAAAFLVGQIMTGLKPEQLPTVYLQTMILQTVIPYIGRDHEECAGLANLLAIYQLAADKRNADTVLRDTLRMAPFVDQSRFGRFVDAARLIIARPEMFPAPDQTPAMPRLLQEAGTPHAADYLVAIQQMSGAHVLFDTEGAWGDGRPGYAQNVGLFRLIAQLLTEAFGGNADDVEAALLYFAGASVPILPRPNRDVPLDIIRS